MRVIASILRNDSATRRIRLGIADGRLVDSEGNDLDLPAEYEGKGGRAKAIAVLQQVYRAPCWGLRIL